MIIALSAYTKRAVLWAGAKNGVKQRQAVWISKKLFQRRVWYKVNRLRLPTHGSRIAAYPLRKVMTGKWSVSVLNRSGSP
jgi:hypothetical protein